ncbi:MAG: RNA pseudouridine synthase [Flavobacteriaceae bacterium]|nr:RNA pseudouridine synthase [Flavobacteriaceae bacterium]|tara:strand:- start:61 stop:1086 length:1026 start_codon:yes stop_codon:yes gene_type:complete
MEQENNFDAFHEHYSFGADAGQEPLRVDKFLMNRIENATRNKIQQAATAGYIHVNDQVVKSNYRVKAGDVVRVFLTYPPHEDLLVAEEMPIDIVFEDDSLLVVNKAAGIVVHPGHGNYTGTLINGLIYHFDQLPKNSNNRPGLVHRIDKDTSGLLVVAKSDKAMANLAQQFHNKTSERQYLALVWGDVLDEKGTVDGHLGRDPKNRLLMNVFPDGDKGKAAITHYEVVERFGYVTLIKCVLETGRTHQIRAHMKHIGHTLFNDARYGGDKILKGTTFTKYKQFVDNSFKQLPRQALHAQTLGFVHPKTKKKMSFEAPLPDDFSGAVEKWRNYAQHQHLGNS